MHVRHPEAAVGYVGGELVAGMRSTPVFSDVTVRHFEILTDRSARTGVIEPVAAAVR